MSSAKHSIRRGRRLCACVLHAGLSLVPALGLTAAHAGPEFLFPIVTHADVSPRYGASPNRFEAGGEMHRTRYNLKPISVAELGRQIRKADGQIAGSLAVVYPDIGEPYRSIFAQIIEGIEEGASTGVRNYPVGPNQDPADFNEQLKRNGAKVVIALGRQGLKAVSGLDRDIPVVVGGVLAIPEAGNRNMTGVSLTPDPALLFSRLKSLLPGVKRVIVVYNPHNNEWLIRLAREAAKAQGLELLAHEARDLAGAARLYEAAFASSESRRDAVWLPQDGTTVDENTILPLVLKESWNRNVPVFSSSFLHVKKGALFALYPDNVEMGRTLASSALAAMSGEVRRRGVLPLREVLVAVNLRTASHIGLNIGYQQQRSFDSIFPEP